MSSCGAKYPVCGPNTAIGLPLSVYWPETTRALDMPRFRVNRFAGSTPASIEPVSFAMAGRVFRLAADRAERAEACGETTAGPALGAVPGAVFAAVPAVAEPVGSNTSCCAVTDPGSGMATPEGLAGVP